MYGGSDQIWEPELTMYCNVDWASSSDRKSINGYIFLLAGGAISWSSKKQATVALSTAEAEYVAATHAAKQILWHRSLFDELDIQQPETSVLLSTHDNVADIFMKGLSRPSYEDFTYGLGVMSNQGGVLE